MYVQLIDIDIVTCSSCVIYIHSYVRYHYIVCVINLICFQAVDIGSSDPSLSGSLWQQLVLAEFVIVTGGCGLL